MFVHLAQCALASPLLQCWHVGVTIWGQTHYTYSKEQLATEVRRSCKVNWGAGFAAFPLFILTSFWFLLFLYLREPATLTRWRGLLPSSLTNTTSVWHNCTKQINQPQKSKRSDDAHRGIIRPFPVSTSYLCQGTPLDLIVAQHRQEHGYLRLLGFPFMLDLFDQTHRGQQKCVECAHLPVAILNIPSYGT